MIYTLYFPEYNYYNVISKYRKRQVDKIKKEEQLKHLSKTKKESPFKKIRTLLNIKAKIDGRRSKNNSNFS